jgi:hypothetical protein
MGLDLLGHESTRYPDLALDGGSRLTGDVTDGRSGRAD